MMKGGEKVGRKKTCKRLVNSVESTSKVGKIKSDDQDRKPFSNMKEIQISEKDTDDIEQFHNDQLQENKICNYGDLPLILSQIEVTNVLGISKSKTYELMKAKGFPSFPVGKQWRVAKEDFIKWMESQKEMKDKLVYIDDSDDLY